MSVCVPQCARVVYKRARACVCDHGRECFCASVIRENNSPRHPCTVILRSKHIKGSE